MARDEQLSGALPKAGVDGIQSPGTGICLSVNTISFSVPGEEETFFWEKKKKKEHGILLS